MTFSTETLADRGRSHTRLREVLSRRSSILHAGEREVILDAADALLFDEAEAREKRDAARDVIGELLDSGRWLPEPADEALVALDGCAGPELVGR